MKTLNQTPVGEIVKLNLNAAKIMEAHHIDFYCKGAMTLEKACLEREIKLEQIVKDLEGSLTHMEPLTPQEITNLVRRIVTEHHRYVESTAPAIQNYLHTLCEKYGPQHPELNEIKKLFDGAIEALTAHMKKEEIVLFPYIQAMVEAKNHSFTLSRPHFGSVVHPIEMMREEHSTEGDRFREISKLSNGYQSPSDGCEKYALTYALLKEFEEDLHWHIHLENNVLFPATEKLYASFEFENKSV